MLDNTPSQEIMGILKRGGECRSTDDVVIGYLHDLNFMELLVVQKMGSNRTMFKGFNRICTKLGRDTAVTAQAILNTLGTTGGISFYGGKNKDEIVFIIRGSANEKTLEVICEHLSS